jgi:hypothetical protein
VAVGLKQAFEADRNEEGYQFSNEGRDDPMRRADIEYPSSGSGDDYESGDDAGDQREYMSGGHTSSIENDSDSDLGIN